MKIGYQGVPGAYSEIAAIKYFGTDNTKVPYDNFRDMIYDVHNELIDYAVLPIENSTTGAITRALDLMKDYNVFIVGEEFVKVNHCLITFKETNFEDIQTIYSHPEALKQCDDFFDSNKTINKVAYLDTAKSVEYIIQLNDKKTGALASRRAAEIYGMKILREDMQDNKLNITRFGIISFKNSYSLDANVVSVFIVTPHKSGSLFESIKVFNDYGVNLLKIESRPIIEKPFNYGFYINFEGNLLNTETMEVLESLKEHCEYIKIIGNYKENIL